MAIACGLVFASHQLVARADQTVLVDSWGQFNQYTGATNPGNAAGAFVFRIPLDVPPNPAGPTPRIVLSYSSTSGNDVLGVGWVLEGIPKIARCIGVKVPDGAVRAVDLQPSDRLCLGAQHLVLAGGSYGDIDAEYRTHLTYWDRIRTVRADTGERAFELQSRDGTTYRFGITEQTRIVEPRSKVVSQWLLTSIEDKHGNYIECSYSSDPANHMAYLQSVAYGTARQQDLRSGPATRGQEYARLTFATEARPDLVAHYRGGLHARVTRRLSGIDLSAGGLIVRAWRLLYEQDPSAGASRLIEVQQQERTGQALPPFKFVYSNDPGKAEEWWTANRSQPNLHHWGERRWFADINGDGRPDYVAQNNDDRLHWNINQGNEWGASLAQAGIHGPNRDRWLADINGDGKADYVAKDGLWLYWNLAGGGDGTQMWGPRRQQYGSHGLGAGGRWMIDVNGDGKLDYVTKNGDATIHWNLSLGDGTTDAQWGAPVSQGGLAPWGKDRWFVDLNGDGRVDYLSKTREDTLTWNLAVGDGTSDTHWGPTQEQGNVHGFGTHRWLVDINGDGLPDYVALNERVGALHWNINTGRGWGPPMSQSGLQQPGRDRGFADLNGDGKADYYIQTGEASLRWHIAQGDGLPISQSTKPMWGSLQIGGTLHGIGQERWFIDMNGDGRSDYVTKNIDDVIHWNQGRGTASNLMVQATEPWGTTLSVQYSHLADAKVVVHTGQHQYPVRGVPGRLPVVREVSKRVPGRDVVTHAYRYEDPRYDLNHRQWLGVAKTVVSEAGSRRQWATEYEQTPLLSGLSKLSIQSVMGGIEIVRETSTWRLVQRGPSVSRQLVDKHTQNLDLLGKVLTDESEQAEFDDYDNVFHETRRFGDGQTAETYREHESDEQRWLLGLVKQQLTSAKSPSGGRVAEFRTIVYDNAGLVDTETVNADIGETRSVKFERDWRGLPRAVTVSANGVQPRTTKFEHDEFGDVRVITNPLGHKAHIEWDHGTGEPVLLTDANGGKTTRVVDGFGRLISESGPSNVVSRFTYVVPAVLGPVALTVVRERDGAPRVTTEYDSEGQQLATTVASMDGPAFTQRWRWDARGRLSALSQPTTDLEAWTRFSYDERDRLVETEGPNGQARRLSYDGARVTSTDGSGKTTAIELDQRGSVLRYQNSGGATTRYEYNANGQATSIVSPDGATTSVRYDRDGRVTMVSDSNDGLRRMFRDPLGQIRLLVDHEGNRTTFEYDLLGRTRERVAGGVKATWSYDRVGALGLLADATSGDGSTIEYRYDNMRRLSSVKASLGSEAATMSFDYDELGRLSRTHYPNDALVTRNVYGPNGYLVGVRDDSNDRALWELRESATLGLPTRERFGSGAETRSLYSEESSALLRTRTSGSKGDIQSLDYAYDAEWRVQQRRDDVNAVVDEFEYDATGRLSTWLHGSSDVRGEKTARTFRYGDDGNLTAVSSIGALEYGEAGAGPHALSSVDRVRRGSRATVRYNLNGAVVQGLERRIDYFASGEPTRVRGQAGGAAIDVTYRFDANGARIGRTAKIGSGGSTSVLNVGRFFERLRGPGALIERFYVFAGGRIVALMIDSRGTARRTRYVHRDHLGSVTALSDEAGVRVAWEEYEPFGRPTRLGEEAGADLPSVLRIGSLGHAGAEHDVATGLIWRGRRLMDPSVGRFLSPDTVLHVNGGAEFANRYSYAANDPVNFVDRNGETAWANIGKGGLMTLVGTAGVLAMAAPVAVGVSAFAAGVAIAGAGLSLSAGVVTTAVGVSQLASAQDDPGTDEALEIMSGVGSLVGQVYALVGGFDAADRAHARNVGSLVTIAADVGVGLRTANVERVFAVTNEAAREIAARLVQTFNGYEAAEKIDAITRSDGEREVREGRRVGEVTGERPSTEGKARSGGSRASERRGGWRDGGAAPEREPTNKDRGERDREGPGGRKDR